MAKPKHANQDIAVQQDENTLFPQAVQLCKQLLSNWRHLPQSDIKVQLVFFAQTIINSSRLPTYLYTSGRQVSKVSGGITNLLLKLTPGGDNQPVLVRVFGDHTDEVINRKEEETISLQLYEAGFGAQVRWRTS